MIPVSTWTEGYITDINYTTNFYYHQHPDFLNFCCLLYGYQPLDLTKEFNYCELGCGTGLTLNILALLYPNGNFYGIDFNPDHILFATSLKDKLGLQNIKFFETSFREMVEEKIEEFPEFNIITLHGVFSWISHENRMRIVEFARRKLKPGGILNVSYNDMCGWFMRVPFQKLIVDFAKLFPEVISLKKVEIVLNIIKKLQEGGSKYFNFPIIKKTLGKAGEMPINYIVHEYLNEDWQPLFFSEVCSYMQKAKLKYLGMADPVWFFDDVLFNNTQLKALNSLRSMYMREISKDYILNLPFRKDIYIKGGFLLPKEIYNYKLYNEVKFLLIQPSEEDEEINKIELKYTERRVNINKGIVSKLLEELIETKTIEELREFDVLKDVKKNELFKIIAMLIHKGIVIPIMREPPKIKEKCKYFNKYVAKDARYKNELKFFLLPKAGTAIPVSLINRLVYDAIVNEGENNINDIIIYVKSFIEQRDLNWEAFGKDKSKEEILNKEVSECIEKYWPFWERLEAI